MLIRLIEDPSREPEQIVLPTELVVRGSSAPPPATA
jgi:DNA-binding LacI/PurR family transcriptional regulator